MAHLATFASDGLAVLDRDRRFVYVNPAGAQILGVDPELILGQPALVFETGTAEPSGAVRLVANAGGTRRIHHAEHSLGEQTLVVFSDTTETHRGERRLAAFVQTATALAERTELPDFLNGVAAALQTATGTAACTVVLYQGRDEHIEHVGTAGGYPDDYQERLAGCLRRGAPLATLTAYRTRDAFVASDWAQQVLQDPRWSPMHPVIRGTGWGALVAAPLLDHDRPIGALTAFYHGEDQPAHGDVEFLSAIGAIVAVAVSNHRLVATLETKAAIEERHRIARELHDSVSQMLFSLNLQSRAVRRANDSPAPGRRERVREGLEQIQTLTNDVLAEMRSLIDQLRPVQLRDAGVVKAIERYAASIGARQAIAFRIEDASGLPALAPETEAQIFRIAQEALNNAVRHARARSITVLFSSPQPGRLRLMISDDGTGFDPDATHPGHHGLETMRERCRELSGSLTVNSRPGRSVVTAEVAVSWPSTASRIGSA